MPLHVLQQLADAAGQSIPEDLPFRPGMGLQAALARFAFTLSVMQGPDAVRRVADAICDEAIADGVSTLEILFAPQLHRGASVQTIVDAALDGISGRAGLILCGLFGEPPTVLEGHVQIAASRPGVVGIDLAGGPAPAHKFTLKDYAAPYRLARQHGIGRTVHAGEGRPAREIAVAVELLHAQRIGHGCTVLDDGALTDRMISEQIVIEACPTSNMQTGVISSIAAHPLAQWLKRGIRACINTDNTYLSQTQASEEHRRALAIDGMTTELLELARQHGHAAAFRR